MRKAHIEITEADGSPMKIKGIGKLLVVSGVRTPLEGPLEGFSGGRRKHKTPP